MFYFEPLVVIRLLFLSSVAGQVFSSVLVPGNSEGVKCASKWTPYSAWAEARCSGRQEAFSDVVAQQWGVGGRGKGEGRE